MSGRLIQISGVVVDLVYSIDALPASGGEAEASVAFVSAGGGFNAMIAAKRAGAEVAYAGALGSGVFADIAARALEAEGIACLYRRRKAIDQGNCVVLVDAAGERSFVSYHGAERQLEIDDFESIRPTAEDWILVSGYGLNHPESTSALTAWLRALPQGPQVLFDPGPMVAHIPDAALASVLARADWVSANRQEAEVLTGLADPASSARSLSTGRVGALVRIGKQGCWLGAPATESEHLTGFEVITIDTTGAGDAHDGAFIAAFLSGYSPRSAGVFANAAAALSTMRRGPATAPNFAGIRTLLTARGVDVRVFPEVRCPISQSEATLRKRF
jgi:sugar/nucleoside kinase (ribokinase family)